MGFSDDINALVQGSEAAGKSNILHVLM